MDLCLLCLLCFLCVPIRCVSRTAFSHLAGFVVYNSGICVLYFEVFWTTVCLLCHVNWCVLCIVYCTLLVLNCILCVRAYCVLRIAIWTCLLCKALVHPRVYIRPRCFILPTHPFSVPLLGMRPFPLKSHHQHILQYVCIQNWKIIWHYYLWYQRIIKVWARVYFILFSVFQYHNFSFQLFSKCKCKMPPKRLPRTKSIDCKLSANGLVVITWSVLGNFVSGNFPSPTKCQISSTNSKNISRQILSVRKHPLTGQMLNGLLRPIWWKHFQMNTLYQEASPHWPNAE